MFLSSAKTVLKTPPSERKCTVCEFDLVSMWPLTVQGLYVLLKVPCVTTVMLCYRTLVHGVNNA